MIRLSFPDCEGMRTTPPHTHNVTSMSKDGLLHNASAASLKTSCGKGRPLCLVLTHLGEDGKQTWGSL